MLTPGKVTELLHCSCEPDCLDFKRQLYHTLDKSGIAEFVKDLIAIANSVYRNGEPAGYIVFGIDDKTHEPFDISGQLLLLKGKPITLPEQTQVDTHNQRTIVKIAKDYIAGRNGPPNVNYLTIPHPDAPGSLVGCLEIVALAGPYLTKKEIPQIDHTGKTVGTLVATNQAWIRDGEDSRSLDTLEIMAMRDEETSRRRESRRRQQAVKSLGDIADRWDATRLELPDGNPPAEALTLGPLMSKAQLTACFNAPPQLAQQLGDLEEHWYLNNMVIASPPGSGRTSLLLYLALLRNQAHASGTPLKINRIPEPLKVEEFVEYVETVRKVKVRESSHRLLVFDMPEVPEVMLRFIAELAPSFPRLHFWVTCNPDREKAVVQALVKCLQRSPVVMRLPGYLDADPEFYMELVERICPDRDDVDYLLRQQNMTYQRLVTLYHASRQGVRLRDTMPSRLEQMTNTYSRLTASEQLLTNAIVRLNGLSVLVAQLVCSLDEFSVDSYRRLLESELVYIESARVLPELKPARELPRQVQDFGLFEERVLVDLLSRIDLEASPLVSWSVQHIAKRLQAENVSPDSQAKCRLLIHKCQGDHFCEVCSAHFDSRCRYCPNCGGAVDRSAGVVRNTKSQIQQIPVPFPNAELLKLGTFKAERGVPSDAMHLIRTNLRSRRYHA